MLAVIVWFSISACAQKDASKETQEIPMISMSETFLRPADGIGSLYFQEGSKTPFTGILYGRYDNGELMTTQEYMEGIGNGKWTSYDPDGRKSEEGTYVNNRVEGLVRLFYEDGTVKATGQYRHWKQPIGKWTYYDRTGKEVSEMVYTP